MNSHFDITNIQYIVDEHRNTDFCVISQEQTDDVQSLIGAYLNVLDYYGDRPFLVFLLDKPRNTGKVFKDVYLLNAQQVPLGNDTLLVNGRFLRTCLSTTLEINKKTIPIHTYEALLNLLDSELARQELHELQTEKCMLIGVYPNKHHWTRGKMNALEKEKTHG